MWITKSKCYDGKKNIFFLKRPNSQREIVSQVKSIPQKINVDMGLPHSILLAGVAIMLSITIFATVVGEMLPVSDATPLIGQLPIRPTTSVVWFLCFGLDFTFFIYTYIENSLNAFYILQPLAWIVRHILFKASRYYIYILSNKLQR